MKCYRRLWPTAEVQRQSSDSVMGIFSETFRKCPLTLLMECLYYSTPTLKTPRRVLHQCRKMNTVLNFSTQNVTTLLTRLQSIFALSVISKVTWGKLKKNLWVSVFLSIIVTITGTASVTNKGQFMEFGRVMMISTATPSVGIIIASVLTWLGVKTGSATPLALQIFVCMIWGK